MRNSCENTIKIIKKIFQKDLLFIKNIDFIYEKIKAPNQYLPKLTFKPFKMS